MKRILSFHCAFVVLSSSFLVQTSGKCPAAYYPPNGCFSLEEIEEYGSTSTSMETLYTQYVDKLTEADFTIDGDEVRFIMVSSKNDRFFLKNLFFTARCKPFLQWLIV